MAATKPPTAAAFLKALKAQRSDAEKEKYRRYSPESDDFIGVRMGTVFQLAKAHVAMEPREIEKLLESPIHEARAGALSLMGKQYAAKRTGEERREELYALALRRTDRIDDWDLVDLAGLYVVGPHLVERPRAMLTKLARSRDRWERRLAIVSTAALLRAGKTADTFRLAKLLLKDEEPLVQKGVGWMLRFAGDADPEALRAFLDKHAPGMARVALRAALEKQPKAVRARYLA